MQEYKREGRKSRQAQIIQSLENYLIVKFVMQRCFKMSRFFKGQTYTIEVQKHVFWASMRIH